MAEKVAVTGAFGYTGKYIARRLLADGREVITLTGRPEQVPAEFAGKIKAHPFSFDHPDELRSSLTGVATVYNTYWVRFNHGDTTYAQAVENTRNLIRAARQAGVQRFVHVSITNPTIDSPLPYFSGKAALEQDLRESGLAYAILRPTVIYGLEDILINNIAWLMRRFPVFAIPGNGEYPIQPIYVEDMADLAIAAGNMTGNEQIDAVGPQIFSFNELAALIGRSVGSHTRLVHVAPQLALWMAGAIGAFLGDVVLTADEVAGLSAGLLVSKCPPTGKTRLSDWLTANAGQVGSRYASELKRHYR
jgi:NADH dehydrogenase